MLNQSAKHTIWLLLLLLLAGCQTAPERITPASPEPIRTANPTLLPSPSPALTATLQPEPSPSAAAETLTGQVAGTAGVLFVGETVPDGTQLEAGQAFRKTWTLKNSSGAPWGEAYALAVFSSTPAGEHLGSPDTIPLPHEVAAGEQVEIGVDLVAPSQDGSYTVVWKLMDENGLTVFGSEVWVSIRVGEAQTNTSVTAGDLRADLTGASAQGGEVSVDFCMQMPDEHAWYPWQVYLQIGEQQYSPYQSLSDPATALGTYKCFTFNYTVNATVSGAVYQLSIGKIELPPEVYQDENCRNAKEILTTAYPGLNFTCTGPGMFYAGLILPAGMSAEEADVLIMDAMSHAIYGPWVLGGALP